MLDWRRSQQPRCASTARHDADQAPSLFLLRATQNELPLLLLARVRDKLERDIPDPHLVSLHCAGLA
jgi:hypothetical protein